jgi:hypothetical protein
VQARKEAAAAAAAAAAAGDDHPDRRVLAEREEACWLSRSSSRTSTRSRISNHYSDTYVLHSAVFFILSFTSLQIWAQIFALFKFAAINLCYSSFLRFASWKAAPHRSTLRK